MTGFRACARCGLVHRWDAKIQEIQNNAPESRFRCVRCHRKFPRHAETPWPEVALQETANQASSSSQPKGSIGSLSLYDQRTISLTIASLAFYVPAILLPLMTIERLGIRHRTSLLQGTLELIADGEYFVGGIVLIFSIVLPLLKLLCILEVAFLKRFQQHWRSRLFHFVEIAGRWSMLDVLLLALLVMTIKLQALVKIHLGPAVLAFAACVLLSLAASWSFRSRSIWETNS